ncbi:retrovirus-related pol polyprotein from transposon TNT 1-94 [Tanacetum coccineum]
MTTLAEYIIVTGVENRPLMLEKSMYDSWASCIHLFMKRKKHEDGQTRPEKYSKLTEAQQLQDDCDVQETNIILHGLPPDGETLYEYYWRFSQLINDMHTIGMTMHQVQVNTKSSNALPPEWSKFVTDVKLAKSLYTTNYDQFSPMYPPPQQFTPVYAAPIHHQQHHTLVNPLQHLVSPQPFISPSVTQQSQAEFPQLDYGLSVPTFQQSKDPIDYINNAMTFLSDVASRFTVQQVQGRQTQSFAVTRNRGIATTSRGNYATGQPRVVKCYNCQGEGHMARQCTQPKRPRNFAWFKEKLMLVEAQEVGQILDEEELAFFADPGIEEAPDCNDISSAKAVLMENLSSCDSDVLSEVPYSDTYPNDMITQDVQEMNHKMRVISKEHAVIFVINDEETLILEDESRSKMLDKQNDPISLQKKINIPLIDYSKLNKLKEDFGKRFANQKELSAEQALWLKHSNYNPDTSVKSHTPVRIEAPSELPKSRKIRASRSVGSSSKAKIVEPKSSNTKEPKQSWGSTVFNVPSSSLIDCRFGNDHITKIIGYGDYQMGNVTISRVYYMEGLGQNLFSVGQFCDSDLEVAFRKHTYFIRDFDGVDLLKGSRGSNLYTLSMDKLLLSSPICLLSKASKTKSWLWHRRLSHLNFDYITSLAKQGLVRGLPKLKYQKDHLCSACALGKSKKHFHKPKAKYYIQEKLHLLHMDLCRPMRIQSINGIKYILVILDDYSRFTWVKFLRSKDEVPEFMIKFLKLIQVRLNATIHNIRTDNGTKFVNQKLKAYYEEVGISHQTSVARSPQQNCVVERHNHTLVTRMIIESIHVDLDELIAMASEQFSPGPGPKLLTPGIISSGLVQNIPSSTPYVPPTKND